MCTHSQTTQARHKHSHNSPRYVSIYCDDDFLFCSLLDELAGRFPTFMAGWLWDFVYRAVVAALGWDDWLVSVLAPRDNTKRTTILDIRLRLLLIKKLHSICKVNWDYQLWMMSRKPFHLCGNISLGCWQYLPSVFKAACASPAVLLKCKVFCRYKWLARQKRHFRQYLVGHIRHDAKKCYLYKLTISGVWLEHDGYLYWPCRILCSGLCVWVCSHEYHAGL